MQNARTGPDKGGGPLFGTGREANLVLLGLLCRNANPSLGIEPGISNSLRGVVTAGVGLISCLGWKTKTIHITKTSNPMQCSPWCFTCIFSPSLLAAFGAAAGFLPKEKRIPNCASAHKSLFFGGARCERHCY